MPITDYGVKSILTKTLAETPQTDAIAVLALRAESNLPAGSAEKLDFIGHVPVLREWLERRQVSTLIPYDYQVTLKKFEASFSVPLDWIKNDKTDGIKKRAGDLAKRYNPQWAARRVAGLINTGSTTPCFDKQNFFSTAHAWGKSGTLSNSITFNAANHLDPTAYEAAQSIVRAVNQFYSFRDDQGEPINEGMTDVTIVAQAGTALAAALTTAVAQEMVDTGNGTVNNPVRGLAVKIKLVLSTRITLADSFAVVNSTPGAAPFVFLENKNDFSLTMKGAGSDYEHDEDAWEYGIKSVGEAGYGLFTDAVLMTLN